VATDDDGDCGPGGERGAAQQPSGEQASGPRSDAHGCIYTWLPDDGFHLEVHDRAVIVSCCSGRGFNFSPRIGERAASLEREAAA
jgi:glycine/D-amino acid oxidase-like deaminating enzyme